MRKTVALTVFLLLVLAFICPALAAPAHKAVFVVGQNIYTVDGQPREMDAAPFVENGRTFVPVRYMAYALGVAKDDVGWVGETGTVSLRLGGKLVRMTVGSRTLYVNAQSREMDVAPLVREGRTYLPARFVAEALDYEVGWDAGRQAVLTGPPGQLPEAPATIKTESTLETVNNKDSFVFDVLGDSKILPGKENWRGNKVLAEAVEKINQDHPALVIYLPCIRQKTRKSCNRSKGGLTSLRNLKQLIFILATCLSLALLPRPSPAATWDYTISTSDTPSTIDTSATTAAVDTTNREIKLPQAPAPDIVAFWPSGEMDYVVLTTTGIKHYSYNGTTMVENTLLNVNISNPLALAAPDPFPDVVVADASGIKHFSFSGSAMMENPALSVAGLTGIAAIGAAGQTELAALANNQIQHYSFNGTSMARNTVLEPSVQLSNPIDVALASGGYDTAVLEPNRVRWFNFTGSSMAENPALAVTGLTNAVAFAVADPDGNQGSPYDLAVVDGNQVKQFSFDGTRMVYNSTLSVTSGLTNPRAVAIWPGAKDGTFGKIIVDGNQVRFYAWSGTSLVYDPNRSVTVSNIIQGAGYRANAASVSLPKDPGTNAVKVRVRAAHELPNNTSVTWSVTADGTNWVKRWRVRGTATETVLEISPDNGNTWNPIGTANDALPSVDNKQLWVTVSPGRAIKWKAELATSNPDETPKIATSPRGGVTVRLDTNSAPNPPDPVSYGTCFTMTTPTLSWTFSDPDPGENQSAYQVQIARASDYALVLDSGKVISGQTQYTVPTSTAPDVPGPLWSSGAYQFKYRIMVWDQADTPSAWSNWADFCVVAFERPRVAQIVSPPAGQVPPDPANPATHVMITQGVSQAQLPKAKAGAKVVLLVDSVGPLNSVSWAFPYTGPQGNKTATVNIPAKLPDGATNNPMYSTGSAVNRWAVEFWTNPSLAVCPTGTVVQMQLSGNGGAGATQLNAPPYAAGVVVTEGSIYSDWFVVLQGRDEGS